MPREIETYKTVIVNGHVFHGKDESTLTFNDAGSSSRADVYTALTNLHTEVSSVLNELNIYLNTVFDLNMPLIALTYTQNLINDPPESVPVETKIHTLFTNFNKEFNNMMAKVYTETDYNYSITAAAEPPVDFDLSNGMGVDFDKDSYNGYLDTLTSAFLEYINHPALTTPKRSFTENIHLEFIPDEIILKHVSVNDQDGANSSKINIISSDLVEGGQLFTIPGSSDETNNVIFCESVDIPFRNKNRPINGVYNFSVLNHFRKYHHNITTFNYFLSLTFLFVKFKSK